MCFLMIVPMHKSVICPENCIALRLYKNYVEPLFWCKLNGSIKKINNGLGIYNQSGKNYTDYLENN